MSDLVERVARAMLEKAPSSFWAIDDLKLMSQAATRVVLVKAAKVAEDSRPYQRGEESQDYRIQGHMDAAAAIRAIIPDDDADPTGTGA